MMFFSNQAFSLKELTSKMGGVFLLFFADLKKESLNLKKKKLYYSSSPGRFVFGLEEDRYLTPTFFRLIPCVQKNFKGLKTKKSKSKTLQTASFNSSWICRHDCRTYATRLVLVVLCLEAWRTQWPLKSKSKAKKRLQICGAYFCEQLFLGLCFQHSLMIK